MSADDNDLPWPFTVSQYPSLVYFPAHDKADSISYPPHLDLTLPNLVRFVRQAAGPTSKIGVCSHTCILTNLRTAATTLCKLQAERSRSVRAIYRLQLLLRAFFVEPSSSHPDPDSVEQNFPADDVLGLVLPCTASSEKSDVNRVHADTVNAEPVAATKPDDEERTHFAEDFELCGAASELCNNMQSGATGRQYSATSVLKDFSYSTWTSCSVEHLLGLRDELATLRRHLHCTEVKLSLLRRLYSHVLLPAAIDGSKQLERRRWRSIRHHNIVTSLYLHNYRDYISGWDMGS